jgi:hypothetical protein
MNRYMYQPGFTAGPVMATALWGRAVAGDVVVPESCMRRADIPRVLVGANRRKQDEKATETPGIWRAAILTRSPVVARRVVDRDGLDAANYLRSAIIAAWQSILKPRQFCAGPGETLG